MKRAKICPNREKIPCFRTTPVRPAFAQPPRSKTSECSHHGYAHHTPRIPPIDQECAVDELTIDCGTPHGSGRSAIPSQWSSDNTPIDGRGPRARNSAHGVHLLCRKNLDFTPAAAAPTRHGSTSWYWYPSAAASEDTPADNGRSGATHVLLVRYMYHHTGN